MYEGFRFPWLVFIKTEKRAEFPDALIEKLPIRV
jgi:hypothetical protein